jgi:hypothetical protein
MGSHCIWSTDWFNNPAKQAEILRRVIESRFAELKAKEAQFTLRLERPSSVADQTSGAVVPPPRDCPIRASPDIRDELVPRLENARFLNKMSLIELRESFTWWVRWRPCRRFCRSSWRRRTNH